MTGNEAGVAEVRRRSPAADGVPVPRVAVPGIAVGSVPVRRVAVPGVAVLRRGAQGGVGGPFLQQVPVEGDGDLGSFPVFGGEGVPAVAESELERFDQRVGASGRHRPRVLDSAGVGFRRGQGC